MATQIIIEDARLKNEIARNDKAPEDYDIGILLNHEKSI
jgi:hypothetical protein